MNDFPACEHLLGAYFHQDWPDEYVSADEAISAILQDEEEATILEMAEELRAIIASVRSEEDLATLLVDQIGCYYNPAADDRSWRSWLGHLLLRIG